MQGDDYSSTYPYNGGDGNDYTLSDAAGGGEGGGGKIVTSGCAECYNCLSLSGGGVGGGGGGLGGTGGPKSPSSDYVTENSWAFVGIGSFLIGLLGSTTFFYW